MVVDRIYTELSYYRNIQWSKAVYISIMIFPPCGPDRTGVAWARQVGSGHGACGAYGHIVIRWPVRAVGLELDFRLLENRTSARYSMT